MTILEKDSQRIIKKLRAEIDIMKIEHKQRVRASGTLCLLGSCLFAIMVMLKCCL